MRSFLSLLAFLFLSTPVFAQGGEFGDDVEEAIKKAEEIYNSECVQQGVSDGNIIGKAHRKARSACANLRKCKSQCRGAKRGARQANRAKKRDCKAECRGKKGKAKRECKRACRKAAKPGKKSANQAKRGCMKDCRAKHKTPACKSARKAVVASVGKAVVNLFKNRKDCENQVNAALDAVKKADQAEEKAQN